MSEPVLSPLASALAVTIADHPTRRVDLEHLRGTFARHDPTGAATGGARVRLADALIELAGAELVTMPSTSRQYERHAEPELPLWVMRPAAHHTVRSAPPARLWRRELVEAAEIARSPADFDVLTAVDEFLRDGGSARPVVPHRERSLQLFGNEKALDRILKTNLFTSGALTLALLRAYITPLPLTATHTGDPGPRPKLLIVENHATYASALTLARARARNGEHALAIGWGGGNQIAAGHRGVDPLAAMIGGVRQLDPVPLDIAYFGDLDGAGLRAPAAAAEAAVSLNLPRVRPALPLYRALFEHGIPAVDTGRQVPPGAVPALVQWLADDDLRTAAAELLLAGRRLAQEAVGFEVLSTLSAWC